jgi:hypothetical protein
MTIAAPDAHNVGVAIGALMIPLIGLILLIVGLIERTRSKKQPPPMPPGYVGYPPPTAQGRLPVSPATARLRTQMPPGYAPFPPTPSGATYPPPSGHWPPPRPKPRGTALIVTGAVILGLSLVGGVVRVADTDQLPAWLKSRGGPFRFGTQRRLAVGTS